MKVRITTIKRSHASDQGDHYVATVEVDGTQKQFVITLLKNQLGDMSWDREFDQEFLRLHVDIGIKIMDLVGEFHDGRKLTLPQEFSD